MQNMKISCVVEPLVDRFVQTDSITNLKHVDESMLFLMNKYNDLYSKYSRARAQAYMNIARSYRGKDKKKTMHYLWLSLKSRFSVETVAKLMLTPFGLWKE